MALEVNVDICIRKRKMFAPLVRVLIASTPSIFFFWKSSKPIERSDQTRRYLSQGEKRIKFNICFLFLSFISRIISFFVSSDTQQYILAFEIKYTTFLLTKNRYNHFYSFVSINAWVNWHGQRQQTQLWAEVRKKANRKRKARKNSRGLLIHTYCQFSRNFFCTFRRLQWSSRSINWIRIDRSTNFASSEFSLSYCLHLLCTFFLICRLNA